MIMRYAVSMMQVSRLILLVILVNLLTSCSSTSINHENDVNPPNHLQYKLTEFDFLASDKETRKELGIGLIVSHNGEMYFLEDEPTHLFLKLFLVDAKNQETEIFDFATFIGYEDEKEAKAIRDMTTLNAFWGGNSDRIFMCNPYADRVRLYQYVLSKHSWEDISTKLGEKEMAITAIHGTNLLITQDRDTFQYYSLDLTSGERKKLNLPYYVPSVSSPTTLHDQKDKKILFSRSEVTSDSTDPIVHIGIFDIVKNEVEYLLLPVPASEGGLSFVPNEPTKIAYSITRLVNQTSKEDRAFFEYLILYDYAKNTFEEIEIGDVDGGILGWSKDGNAFYGFDFIMKKE